MNSDTEENLAELRVFLKAIASETRQDILFLFASGQALTVGQVAELAGIGQSTASENLSILKRADVLRSSRDGKTVYYEPNRGQMLHFADQLKQYLEVCCPID